MLGNSHRPDRTDTQQTIETWDHNFPRASHGKLISHVISDLAKNHAAMHLNMSRDTGELCCDSIALWWVERGRAAWPGAKRLLTLCDGGGSHSATHDLFQEDLQRLAHQRGLELRVGPHINQSCPGVIFHSMQITQQLMASAKTTTDLRVTVSILEQTDESWSAAIHCRFAAMTPFFCALHLSAKKRWRPGSHATAAPSFKASGRK